MSFPTSPLILVVDDDPAVRTLLERTLSRSHYDVRSVDSAEAARVFIQEESPDLILLDFKLPGTSAPEFVTTSCRSGPLPPFIVVTGHGDERAAVQMMKLGALDYILKDTQFSSNVVSVVERAFAQLEVRKRLRQSEEDRKRLERELLNVSERERRSIGNDLHDGVAQRLIAVSLIAQTLADSLTERSLKTLALEITRQIQDSISEIRRLARGLSPISLTEDGFAKALVDLASTAERTRGVQCTVNCPPDIEFHDPEFAVQLYRIAQEAVNNALKHAAATAISISVSCSDGLVQLEITDNGSGLCRSASPGCGMGLHIIESRARLIGGKLELISKPESGVRVRCVCPGLAACVS